MGFSVIALLDGSPSCSEESVLGYGGIPLWTAMLLYLMAALYLVCEHHFVPSLQVLGEELGLSEDAQGATLMAAGSSSPEFFTALIGCLFYSKANPGPGTIVGSAVFNVCVIVGCSALVAPRPLLLNKFPLYRDSLAYLVASCMVLLFYEGITPGYIDIWESLIMTIVYILYTLLVCRREMTLRILSRCFGNGFGGANTQATTAFTQVRNGDASDGESVGASGDALEMQDIGGHPKEGGGRDNHETGTKKHIEESKEGDNGATAAAAAGVGVGEGVFVIEDDTKLMMDGIDGHQQQRRQRTGSRDTINSEGTGLDEPLRLSVSEGGEEERKAYLRHSRSAMERARRKCVGCWTVCWKYLKMPLYLMFKYSIPDPEFFTFKYCFVITFAMSIMWLALLTFLVVDLAEKLGNCMGISEDLIGLSVLAIGSSLPDCISSVLIAMECKGDMAVCNALGSNVFDLLFCLGFTFFVQSCIQKGASIPVESGTGFSSLIIGLFIAQALFNGIIFYSNHMLQRWHAYFLFSLYALFVVWFIVDYEIIVPTIGSA
mmetsp:Transcript_17999/g.32210  ORF Transcript_17999/g.32210 Transcript_17999/m.32210 type:complete len:546 (-) Transcript_17999:400-2037(-)|eukprot:CAMPEP_0197533090 /NCGR_PEP_ID=MMETSP1318-20131121/42232_1 /TAXON_ID=552666 /ORGANISM="Partenskyella glossopodia, Strain RCC365" /LENGTH=545 /DNA_ID=CAMNT_0043089867 /DNA_START=29 /DNA_END=1666 /DNA_ORIENTATION=+